MIHIKLFEDFKLKHIELQDVIDCIKNNGFVYSKSIKDYPEADGETPIKALSVDNDGLVTVDIDGKEYEIDLENIEKVDY